MLKRLQQSVTRINSQALGYLQYKLHNTGDFESKCKDTIDAVLEAYEREDEEIPSPFQPLNAPFN